MAAFPEALQWRSAEDYRSQLRVQPRPSHPGPSTRAPHRVPSSSLAGTVARLLGPRQAGSQRTARGSAPAEEAGVAARRPRYGHTLPGSIGSRCNRQPIGKPDSSRIASLFPSSRKIRHPLHFGGCGSSPRPLDTPSPQWTEPVGSQRRGKSRQGDAGRVQVKTQASHVAGCSLT